MSKDKKIKEVYLDDQAMADYKEYGISTIEDRAIVGTYDGLKPVMRRILWAMNRLGLHHKAVTVKAALVVGETMGKYHPHGDKSIFDAATGGSHLPQPLIDGSDSNWGTIIENSAAMRYINGRLTKYSDLVFFDKFYMPTMAFVSNYDSTRQEPVNLVTLLPNGLLNGNFGICPGVNTRTPAFTLKSVVDVLQKGLENAKKAKKDDKSWLSVDDCTKLVWITSYGGHLVKSSKNKAQVKQFYKTGIANVEWGSSYTLDEKTNSIRFNKFAPVGMNKRAPSKDKPAQLDVLLSKVAAIKGVASIEDDTKEGDPYQQAFLVRFVKTLKGSKREKAIEHVDKCFRESQRMDVKVTDRAADFAADRVDANLRSITVPELLTVWLKYRIELEQVACAYWIKETDVEIRWHEVMRIAISKLDILFKLIKDKKLDDTQLTEQVSKQLKVSTDEANLILARNLRQLRAMEDDKLASKMKELQAYKKELEGRQAKPAAYVSKHLDSLAKELV